MKSVYLANPYGFSAQQRDLLLPPIIEAIAGLGLDVWEPFSRNTPPNVPASWQAQNLEFGSCKGMC